jgi:hypothetical protein
MYQPGLSAGAAVTIAFPAAGEGAACRAGLAAAVACCGRFRDGQEQGEISPAVGYCVATTWNSTR